jgi:hypothetical protein
MGMIFIAREKQQHREPEPALTASLETAGNAALEANTAEPFERRVVLKIRSDTWKDGPHFDVAEDLRTKFKQARIAVVEDGAGHDANVLVEYAEKKGGGFSAFGAGPANVWGTNITFRLTAIDAASGKVVTDISAEHTTPYWVDDGDVAHAAQKELTEDDTYIRAADFVGAALHLRPSGERLLPLLLWPSSRSAAEGGLTKAGFEPGDDRQRAFLAIGRGDYRKCVTYGHAAVEPLLMLVQKYHVQAYADDSAVVEEYERAVRALRQIGDLSAAKPLVEQLHDVKDSEHPKAKIVLISALGVVGDEFALSDLDMLATDKNALVAQAAKEAAKAIRMRADFAAHKG